MSQLQVSIENGQILVISINRPDKMNALNIALIAELGEVLAKYDDDNAIRGVILTGVGTKAFAAGADIAEFAHFTADEGENLSHRGHVIFKVIEHYPKPIIAAVNGFALGGGCELAMACHLRVATANAKFGQPEVNLGIIPGYGGTQRLVQLIGKGRALELLMTADMITAEQALSFGLVNHVVRDHADLLPKCTEIINKIAKKAPLAIAKIIDSVNAHFAHNRDGFAAEIQHFADCFLTEDFKEGTTAFIEKRSATFVGK